MERLLLSSAGIKNDKISNALVDLVCKDNQDIKIGFISTASYPEKGDKNWHLDTFVDLRKFGFGWIDIVDVSNPNISWKERLEVVDVVLIGGGNTFYLLDQTRKSGFGEWMKENLDKKVFMGISAGSIILTPSIAIAKVEPADDNYLKLQDLNGLNLVPFEVSPHTPEVVSYENAKKYAESIKNKIYLMDDDTAIKVMGNKIEVVTTGLCRELNN